MEVSKEALRLAISSFATPRSGVFEERFTEKESARLAGIWNGNARVYVQVKDVVPEFVEVGKWKIRIWHHTQIRKCFSCGDISHKKANCPSEQSSLKSNDKKDESQEETLTVEDDIETTSPNETSMNPSISHAKKLPEAKKQEICNGGPNESNIEKENVLEKPGKAMENAPIPSGPKSSKPRPTKEHTMALRANPTHQKI